MTKRLKLNMNIRKNLKQCQGFLLNNVSTCAPEHDYSRTQVDHCTEKSLQTSFAVITNVRLTRKSEQESFVLQQTDYINVVTYLQFFFVFEIYSKTLMKNLIGHQPKKVKYHAQSLRLEDLKNCVFKGFPKAKVLCRNSKHFGYSYTHK